MKILTFFGKRIAVIMFIVLFFRISVVAGEKTEFNWFWLFYESEMRSGLESAVYRPFFLKNRRKKYLFEASLLPVVFWHTKTENSDEWNGLLGLIGSEKFLHGNGVSDYDFGFFPFVYYGRSKDEKDNYLMIWPFGGTLKGKFAHEKISPYIFPGFLLFYFYPPSAFFSWKTTAYVILSFIPVYTEYRDKDYNAWAVFWPLIQRGKSSLRDEFRILPFYAHNYKKNFYDNYSWLLICNYRKIIYKKDIHKTLFILPFFGKKWSKSGRISAATLLWPFFSWGYDRKRGDREINLPWPLVQIKDSENPKIEKRIFFPFYGTYRYVNNRTFFITPLYFTLKKEAPGYSSEYYISFLIVWYFKRKYKQEHEYYGNNWRYFKIWPLFHVEYNDRGDFSFNFLSFLPMRDPEGYEKMYQPFWSLVEYRKFKNGEKRLGLLWRFYFQRWGRNFFTAKMFPLFTYSDSGDKLREFSILLSMFGYYNTGKKKYLRILWIPVKIGNSGDEGKTVTSLKEKSLKEESLPKEQADDDIKKYYTVTGLNIAAGEDLNNRIKVTYNFF